MLNSFAYSKESKNLRKKLLRENSATSRTIIAIMFILADSTFTHKTPSDLSDFVPVLDEHGQIKLAHASVSKQYPPATAAMGIANPMHEDLARFILDKLTPGWKQPPDIKRSSSGREQKTMVFLVSCLEDDENDGLLRPYLCKTSAFIDPSTITLFYQGYPVVLDNEYDLWALFALDLTTFANPTEIPLDPSLDERFLQLYGSVVTQQDIDYFRVPLDTSTVPVLVVQESSLGDVDLDPANALDMYISFRNHSPVIVYGSCPDPRLLARALCHDMVYFTDDKGYVRATISQDSIETGFIPGVQVVERISRTVVRVQVQDYSRLSTVAEHALLELPTGYLYSNTCGMQVGQAWKTVKQQLLDLDEVLTNLDGLEEFELGQRVYAATHSLFEVMGVENTLNIPIPFNNNYMTNLGDVLEKIEKYSCVQQMQFAAGLKFFVNNFCC